MQNANGKWRRRATLALTAMDVDESVSSRQRGCQGEGSGGRGVVHRLAATGEQLLSSAKVTNGELHSKKLTMKLTQTSQLNM